MNAAKHGPGVVAAVARGGFHSKFEREVDPDGVLPAEERAARAKLAMRAHMSKLASKRWSRD